MTAKKSAFETIIEKLGGTGKVAAALGKSQSQVCQWRLRYGQFPPELYFVILKLMTKAGHKCPRTAFRFEGTTKSPLEEDTAKPSRKAG